MLNARIKGRNLLRAIIYLPALVAPVIMGTMYYFIFQYQQGALNTVMTALGFQKQAWFNNPTASVIIITVINSIQFVGVSMIIYLAGLQTLDQSVMEAASLDGATGWNNFWNITLPLLQPSFTTSVVLNLIGGLKLFDMIKILYRWRPWLRDQLAVHVHLLGVLRRAERWLCVGVGRSSVRYHRRADVLAQCRSGKAELGGLI